jgi:hypothetical protein
MNIAGKHAEYHKLVYEVRYDFGYVYLDRCGITSNRIAQNYPNWIFNPQGANPQQAPLVHALSGIRLNLGPLKYDFSLDQRLNADAAITKSDVEDFIDQVEGLTAIIHDELELSKFRREGFRVWYIFPTASDEESRDWTNRLGSVSLGDRVTKAFSAKLESLGYTIVIESEERKFRISLNPVERTEQLDLGNESLRQLPRTLPKDQREHLLKQLGQKHRLLVSPGFAVMVDVDAYIEDPLAIDPRDFINESLKAIEDGLPRALVKGA